MTASIRRRRRLILAMSVIALAVAPWMISPGQAEAQTVPTTSTTVPTLPTTTTTTVPPTTTTTRRTATTRRTTTTTSTTTTTLPPTTTTVTTTVPGPTTTTVPRVTTTTIERTTTSGFVPTTLPPENGEAGGGSTGLGGLPSWSLPFVGAGAMLLAIVLATGLIRLATDGVPAVGRGFGSLGYKFSSGWARLTDRSRPAPTQLTAVKPTLGARIGSFFLALSTPFRRLGGLFTKRDSSARRLRLHRRNTVGGLWDRLVLRSRMTRARLGRTRSSVDGRKRYWWLRFRRYVPWLR